MINRSRFSTLEDTQEARFISSSIEEDNIGSRALVAVEKGKQKAHGQSYWGRLEIRPLEFRK